VVVIVALLSLSVVRDERNLLVWPLSLPWAGAILFFGCWSL